MKLAWCTPFSPPSAIGLFSAQVVTALREHLDWQVDIFFPPTAGGRIKPDRGTELGDDAAVVLSEYDAVVYNIGDNPTNHGVFVGALRQVPGLVVLHDISVVHLVLPDLVAGPEQTVKREVGRWYGPESGAEISALRKDQIGWLAVPEHIRDYPMVELVLDNALGVVTHSRYAAGQIRDRFAGDIWTLPLPRQMDEPPRKPAELDMIDDRAVILQAGVPNRNKHIPAVIDAFKRAGIADRAQLVVCGYGTQQDFDDLKTEVSAHGLGESVRLLGRVDDAVLDGLRRRALIGTVLRYPFGEAASAVLLDSMAYGMAVLTVDGGQYAEVPDDTVARIGTPPKAADMVPILRRWVDDPDEARAVGRRGAEYVATHHSAERYARGIAQVLQDAGSYHRRRQLAADLATTLRNLGFAPDDQIVRAVADSASELFTPEPARADEIYGPASEL